MNFQAIQNERLSTINEIYLNGRKDECGEIKKLLRDQPKRKLAYLDVVQRETTQHMKGNTNYTPPHLYQEAIKAMGEAAALVAFGLVVAALLIVLFGGA